MKAGSNSEKSTVYLALGTNLGDRDANLRGAVESLAPQVKVLESSPIYETPPWGYLDQPKFLNQVVGGETALPPLDLMRLLKRLEEEIGRVPSVRYGPRLIDIDILFYDDWVIDVPGLTIPHPRMPGRGFVLLPMADLAPDHRHPLLQVTVSEMLAESSLEGITRYQPGEAGY